MKYIMGIDQGTTGTRAMIFDADVNIIAQAYSEFTQYFPKDGWVEHDAEEIWETTQAMMKKALAEAGRTAEPCPSVKNWKPPMVLLW